MKLQIKKTGNIGEKNGVWKGDNALYGTLHDWVRYHKGKPLLCHHSLSNNLDQCSKRIEWASISHKAKRDLNDYFPLCVRHHRLYDGNMPNPYRINKDTVRKKISLSIKKHWEYRKSANFIKA